jgi:hypothetical protein
MQESTALNETQIAALEKCLAATEMPDLNENSISLTVTRTTLNKLVRLKTKSLTSDAIYQF